MSELSRRETQAGREAWAIICFIVKPVLPPVTTITHIKSTAFEVFKVDERDHSGGLIWPHGESKIDEASRRRCGWPTKASIEGRAVELELPLPPPLLRSSPSPLQLAADIQREIERLRAIDAEFHAPEIARRCDEIERLARMFGRG